MSIDLDKLFASPVRTKIISFFHQNPSSIDTPRGIAAWTDLKLKEVKKALEELAEAKILEVHRAISTVGYAYTRDKGLISKIERHLKKSGTMN